MSTTFNDMIVTEHTCKSCIIAVQPILMWLPSEVNFVKKVGDFMQHNGNKIAPKKSGTVFVLSHN